MIIVHNEAGLGNQMMDYAEYYILKKLNPDQDVYLENILFSIDECHSVVSMWNGYELNKIFKLDTKTDNLSSIMSPSSYNKLIDYVRKSKFWTDDWNYPRAVTKGLESVLGIKFINCCNGGLGQKLPIHKKWKKKIERFFNPVLNIKEEKYHLQSDRNYYCGHSFPLLDNSFDFSEYREDILDLFTFPIVEEGDTYNYSIMNDISKQTSVGIHIRRGDCLVYNGQYYENGYFRKAVKYIKEHVEAPVFYIFSEESARDWCNANLNVIGLDKSDKYIFVKNNLDFKSYIDMQLMSMCKHCIITNSSFGWWACYLNKNENKITISPRGTFPTTISV